MQEMSTENISCKIVYSNWLNYVAFRVVATLYSLVLAGRSLKLIQYSRVVHTYALTHSTWIDLPADRRTHFRPLIIS